MQKFLDSTMFGGWIGFLVLLCTGIGCPRDTGAFLFAWSGQLEAYQLLVASRGGGRNDGGNLSCADICIHRSVLQITLRKFTGPGMCLLIIM